MNRVGPDDDSYALDANFELQELIAAGATRVVVNGHTHRRMVRTLGGLTLINVGTLFREHGPSIAVIDFEERRVMFPEIADARLSGETEALVF